MLRLDYIKAIYELLNIPEEDQTFLNSLKFYPARMLYMTLKNKLNTHNPLSFPIETEKANAADKIYNDHKIPHNDHKKEASIKKQALQKP